jgi:hypothetical protein
VSGLGPQPLTLGEKAIDKYLDLMPDKYATFAKVFFKVTVVGKQLRSEVKHRYPNHITSVYSVMKHKQYLFLNDLCKKKNID